MGPLEDLVLQGRFAFSSAAEELPVVFLLENLDLLIKSCTFFFFESKREGRKLTFIQKLVLNSNCKKK